MFEEEVEIYGQAEVREVLFDGALTRTEVFRKTPVFATMALLARSLHQLVDAGVVVKNEDMYSLAPGHTPLDLVQDNFPQAKVAYILWVNREAPPLAPPDLAEAAGLDDPKRIHSILSALETKHAVVRAGVKGRPSSSGTRTSVIRSATGRLSQTLITAPHSLVQEHLCFLTTSRIASSCLRRRVSVFSTTLIGSVSHWKASWRSLLHSVLLKELP